MFRYLALVFGSVILMYGWAACGQSVTKDLESTEKETQKKRTREFAEAHDDGGVKESPIWENRRLTSLEGLNQDAGIPPDYEWGEPGAGFLQKVLSFSPKGGATYGQEGFPKMIQGPPRGLGRSKGSLHVVSLGCGGSIILEFSSPLIANGPGVDFIIFENAFSYGGKETFSEPAKISVSIDGKKWYSYPCHPEKTQWPFPQCAGVREVYSHPDNSIDPYNPNKAGGDVFDLEDVGLPFARFIKIEDLSHKHPDAKLWCGQYNAGFDLDAVAVRWGYQP